MARTADRSITLVLEPDDDVDTLTRLRRLHARPLGQIVCEPAPDGGSAALAYGLLAALGKTIDLEPPRDPLWRLIDLHLRAERVPPPDRPARPHAHLPGTAPRRRPRPHGRRTALARRPSRARAGARRAASRGCPAPDGAAAGAARTHPRARRRRQRPRRAARPRPGVPVPGADSRPLRAAAATARANHAHAPPAAWRARRRLRHLGAGARLDAAVDRRQHERQRHADGRPLPLFLGNSHGRISQPAVRRRLARLDAPASLWEDAPDVGIGEGPSADGRSLLLHLSAWHLWRELEHDAAHG